MVARISTNYLDQTSLRNLQTASQGMALTSYQITTGLKSQYLSDDAANSARILTLQDVQGKTETYLSNLSGAQNILNSVESALQQMSDLLSDASALATTGGNESSAETRATLAPKAQSLAESFYTLFNTQFNGQYVFSGSNAQQSPITGTAAATPYPGSPVPTTWYQGDTQLPSVVSGAGTTVQYGVTGNDPAFADMKSGLEALWYGLQNNNMTEVNNAISALGSAKTQISSLLGQVGGQLNTISLVSDRHTNQLNLVKNQLDDLQNVDAADALTQFSQQQATLQASMLIISKVNQLSLLDYLH